MGSWWVQCYIWRERVKKHAHAPPSSCIHLFLCREKLHVHGAFVALRIDQAAWWGVQRNQPLGNPSDLYILLIFINFIRPSTLSLSLSLPPTRTLVGEISIEWKWMDMVGLFSSSYFWSCSRLVSYLCLIQKTEDIDICIKVESSSIKFAFELFFRKRKEKDKEKRFTLATTLVSRKNGFWR